MRGRMGGMRFRKLRFAWSVVWGVVAVLLIVLWVRSYSRYEEINAAVNQIQFRCVSLKGFLIVNWTKASSAARSYRFYVSAPASVPSIPEEERRPFRVVLEVGVLMQIWIPTLAALVAVGIPWLRWRFSLRTLLIATTLVAVVLGVIVYAVR